MLWPTAGIGCGKNNFYTMLYGRCHHAATPFFSGRPPLFLLFCDQKRSRKVPLLPRRGARPRGYSPLGTPIMWSKGPKAKKCRSAAFFLTLLDPSPFDPSGAKRNSMGVEGWLPCVKGAGCAIAQTEGLWPCPYIDLPPQGHNPSAPAGHLPLHKGGFALGRRGEHCSPARILRSR